MTDYIHDVFDHGFIVYKGDKALLSGLQASPEEIEHNGEWKIIVVPYIPTAENLAIAIWAAIEKVGIKGLREVRVWETPTCEAVYHGQYKEREVQAIAAPE
jgi:6-pyruvoyl-tetrahydropterin synthase